MPVLAQSGGARARERLIETLASWNPTLGSGAEMLLPGSTTDPTLGMLPIPPVAMTAARGWLMPGRGLQALGSSEMHGVGQQLANMFSRGGIRKAAQGQYQGRLTGPAIAEIEKDVIENLPAVQASGRVVLEGYPVGAKNYMQVPVEEITRGRLAQYLQRLMAGRP